MLDALNRVFDQRIRAAIADVRLIRFTYHGKTRIGEPHDYGIRKSAVRLFVYQRAVIGETSSPRARGWRDLLLDEIGDLDVLDEHFAGSRGGQHTLSTCG